MTMFRINEIFYSLQGEGHNTGRAAIFIRFAGCNLRCPFCDTEFDSYREMAGSDILKAITPYPARFIVLTGGEPTLQVDETFVDLLHQNGYEVAMESNGTRPAPRNLDWLTVSPKVIRGERREERGERLPERDEERGERREERGERLPERDEERGERREERGERLPERDEERGERKEERGERLPDEVKVIFDGHTDPELFLSALPSHPSTQHLYLQPCDMGDARRNAEITAACVAYIKEHPQWRLSLQTHKLIDIK